MVTVIGVDEFGGPEKLKAFDIPAQPVGSGHVRVDVAAAAVSPTDTIHRSGGRAELLEQDPPPYVPGMDIAGVINEIGEGVDHVAVGDAVMGIVAPTASHGGYSSSIVLPARSVARTEGVICSRGMHSSDERAYSSVRARSSRSSEGCNSCHHGSCWGVRWLHGATRCASGVTGYRRFVCGR